MKIHSITVLFLTTILFGCSTKMTSEKILRNDGMRDEIMNEIVSNQVMMGEMMDHMMKSMLSMDLMSNNDVLMKKLNEDKKEEMMGGAEELMNQMREMAEKDSMGLVDVMEMMMDDSGMMRTMKEMMAERGMINNDAKKKGMSN